VKLTGILTGERLSDDLSAHIFTILVSKEEMVTHDDIPVLGDSVSIGDWNLDANIERREAKA
jgi:hypothetical protein